MFIICLVGQFSRVDCGYGVGLNFIKRCHNQFSINLLFISVNIIFVGIPNSMVSSDSIITVISCMTNVFKVIPQPPDLDKNIYAMTLFYLYSFLHNKYILCIFPWNTS